MGVAIHGAFKRCVFSYQLWGGEFNSLMGGVLHLHQAHPPGATFRTRPSPLETGSKVVWAWLLTGDLGLLVAVVGDAADGVDPAVVFDRGGADEGPVSGDQLLLVDTLAPLRGQLTS